MLYHTTTRVDIALTLAVVAKE